MATLLLVAGVLAMVFGPASSMANAMVIGGGGGGGGGGNPTQLSVTSVNVNPGSVNGNMASISFGESPGVSGYTVTGSVWCSSPCSGGLATLSGSTYSIVLSGLSMDTKYSYQITVSCSDCYSGYYYGSFTTAYVATQYSYDQWNPTYVFSSGCGNNYQISPHFNDYAPGDVVYNAANAAKGGLDTTSAYDLQMGFNFASGDWCWPYDLSVRTVSVTIELIDTSNVNDNFAWVAASNNLQTETASSGGSTYTWSVSAQGGTQNGQMGLGLAYTAPTTVGYSYAVDDANQGGGVWKAGTFSASFPGDGTQYVAVDWPLDIWDQAAQNFQWDHIEVRFTWNMVFAPHSGLGWGWNAAESQDSTLGTMGHLSGTQENFNSQTSYVEGGTPSGGFI